VLNFKERELPSMQAPPTSVQEDKESRKVGETNCSAYTAREMVIQ